MHIIDGCQALDLSVSAKYERNVGYQPDVRHIRDGASFEKLGTLRPGFVEPALGMQRLVAQAADPAYMGEEVAFVQGLARFVATRAEALLAMAREIPKFAADNF